MEESIAVQTPGPCASPAPGPAGRRIVLGDRVCLFVDSQMERVYALLARLASSAMPVLVSGETGTGKEHAACALHHWSERREAPLVTVNCAAIPDTLLESELFGFGRGAFTGATTDKPGLLEAADTGTIFLDEIGDLSAAAQAKILRVTETGRFTRLGELAERKVDVRLVAATHRDLDERVRSGSFRQDLYFRLSMAKVTIPPLRDRPGDLQLLMRFFFDEACNALRRPQMAISPAARDALAAYSWPGNVRELENLARFLAATIPGASLQPSHLPPAIVHRPPPPSTREAQPSPGGFRPLADEIADLERRRIVEALAACGGVQTRAAQLLGMPLRTLVTRVRKYGLGRGGRSRDKERLG